MAGAVVQVIYASDANFVTNTATIAATLTVTSGSTLLVYVSNDSGAGAATITVADNVNAGNYTGIDDDTFTVNTSRLANSYHASGGAGSTTVTATLSASRVAKFIIVVELSGVGALDVHAGSGGSGDQSVVGTGTDAVTSGNVTPGSQPGILIGCSLDLGGGTPIKGTGFTAGAAGITFGGLVAALALAESKAISSTSAVPATFTASIAARDHQTFATYFLDASANVTVGLTGSAAAASAGSMVPSMAKAASGSSAAASAGALALSMALALGGGFGTANAGTVGPQFSVAQTGSVATASAGTTTPSMTVATSGSAAAASAGTVTPSSGSADITLALTGSQAAASAGTLGPTMTLATVGSAAAASAGTTAGLFTLAASGAAAAAAAGTLVQSISLGLGGGFGTANAGTLGVAMSRGVSGSQATASAGSMSIPGVTVFAYSTDSRTLTKNGTPFPILGRALWEIMTVNITDVQTVLTDTTNREYNAAEFRLINSDGSGGVRAPFANNLALLPFNNKLDGSAWDGTMTYGNINTDAPDMSTPNTAYWNYIDSVMTEMQTRGILAFTFPSYVGFKNSTQGWMAEMVANGTAKMQTYGAFIANRYKAFENIVWMLGGDAGTGSNTFTAPQIAVEQAMIDGMTSVSGQASVLVDAEWNTESHFTTIGSTFTFPGYQPLNGCYSFVGDVSTIGRDAYGTDLIPAHLLEEPYDQEGPDGNNVNSHATQPVRRFQWWGWLSTIAGYISGNGFVWPFNDTVWQAHLNTQGAQDQARMNAFIKSIHWWQLVPSGLASMRSLVVSGGGTVSGADYVAAACSGSALVAYVPPAHTGSISIDFRSMSGTSTCRWLDPTSGAYQAASPASVANTVASQAFSTPGTNTAGDADWVFVAATDQPLTGSQAAATAGTMGVAVTVALAGSLATASSGTVGPSLTVASAGSAAAASAGTAGAGIGAQLGGGFGISQAGTLTSSTAVALAGGTAAAAAGSLVQSSSVTLPGQAATASAGTLAPSAVTSIAGSSAAASAGTVAPSTTGGNKTVGLVGSQATASAGQMSPSGGVPADQSDDVYGSRKRRRRLVRYGGG